MTRHSWLLAIVLAAFGATLAPILAQSGPGGTLPQIWTGVFSAAQAERGKTLVTAQCARCHGQNNPLAGDGFMLHWEGRDVAGLYRKIKETMPPGRGQTTLISDLDKLDAVAFILQQNGYPGGDAELKDDGDQLAGIRLVPREGVPRLRTGSLVQVLGCVAQGSATSFRLTNATDPVVTTLDDRDSAAAPAPASLGSGALDILDSFPSPAPNLGKRVLVKGLFIKNA